MQASIVIRTYNEEAHLGSLIETVTSQEHTDIDVEVIIVDSGSTDKTLHIAQTHRCNILHIAKEDFSFGRSLNLGCAAARGDYLIFISGHCIPVRKDWLVNLIAPLKTCSAVYSYGRQLGDQRTRFSERQIFRKYFPEISKIPQEGFFCNNANAALIRSVWQEYKFDEELTGLEDMGLSKRLVNDGKKVAYVADAPIYHLHNESWSKIRKRYEREAIALQHIMPQIHISFLDFLRYYVSAILLDMGIALEEKNLIRVIPEIMVFRLMQFWGSYKGNHLHRMLSAVTKEKYFYPK
jgi:glycosyltransferase involved in cell wall biosynthesis